MRPRTRPLRPARLVLFAPLTLALAHCAGIVGIGDVPGGDGGTAEPHHDGSIIIPRRDGGTTPGFDVYVPHHDGSQPGYDSSQPGYDSSQSGRDGSQPGHDSRPPSGDAGGLGYFASNLGTKTFSAKATGPLTLRGDSCQIYTNWPDPPGLGCASGQNPPQDVFAVDLANGAGTAVVWVFTYISVDDQSSLNVSGPNPLILVSLGAVDLAGSIDASADRFDQDALAIPGERQKGPGIGGYSAEQGPQGGGGGSFCGLGGQGSMMSGTPAADSAPGAAYGSANLIPLWGGSPGGGWSTSDPDQVNGNGGGAIQISAAVSITIESGAYITVNGSGGVSPGDEAGTGGGSGGAILLEAPTVTVNGILEANGGEGSDPNDDGAAPPDDGGIAITGGDEGGAGSQGSQVNGGSGQMATGAGGESGGYGGGGGGAGWIRINASHASLSGLVSPSVGSPCASQGPLP